MVIVERPLSGTLLPSMRRGRRLALGRPCLRGHDQREGRFADREVAALLLQQIGDSGRSRLTRRAMRRARSGRSTREDALGVTILPNLPPAVDGVLAQRPLQSGPNNESRFEILHRFALVSAL